MITKDKKSMKLREYIQNESHKPSGVNSKLHGSAFYEAWDRAHGLDGDKK